MTIQLIRKEFGEQTIGEFIFNNTTYYTLEDKIRDKIIRHETAIPKGIYQIVWSYSNKFERYMPELVGVPGFVGIRIHAGNTKADTSGCILLGLTKTKSSILQSKRAVASFEKELLTVIKKEKVYIEIK